MNTIDIGKQQIDKRQMKKSKKRSEMDIRCGWEGEIHVGIVREHEHEGNGSEHICQTARSMERSIFFFLKSHISAPGAQNSPIFFS